STFPPGARPRRFGRRIQTTIRTPFRIQDGVRAPGELEDRQSTGPDTAHSVGPPRECLPAFSARTASHSLLLPIPRRAVRRAPIQASQRPRPRRGDPVWLAESTSSSATRQALPRATVSHQRFYLINFFLSAARLTSASVPCKERGRIVTTPRLHNFS